MHLLETISQPHSVPFYALFTSSSAYHTSHLPFEGISL